jgi:hypothetical protein
VAPSNAEDIAAQWRSVHGLDTAPTQSETLGPRVRRRWRNAEGDILIEVNTLASMGHGTPVGEDLGVAGPYMLDVGVSSTREIASFWGICPARDADARTTPPRRTTNAKTPAKANSPATRQAAPPAVRVPTAPRGRPQPERSSVQKTIEDALRAAGLMR